MDELSLYEEILQLKSPWFVEHVQLDASKTSVAVHVAFDEDEPCRCPQCNQISPRYDQRKRKWRHLDTCQYKTFVHASVPRVMCKTHGCVTIAVPWAEQRSRFTALFEAMVIGWLQSSSISAVSEQLSMSWNAVDGIMDRAVERGQLRQRQQSPTHICVDEVSIKKGQKYMTIVSTPSGNVLAVEDDRNKDSLRRYYDTLTQQAKGKLEVISMDMSPSYLPVTLEEIPGANKKIAFDRFHVAQLINKALDQVRKKESWKLREYLKNNGLTGNRFLWLKGLEKLTREQKTKLDKLQSVSNKTGRAWLLKEYARSLWDYTSRGWAERAWKRWYSRAIRSRLAPFKMVARSIKKNLWGILNAIVLNANNGPAESINSKIKMIKAKARGFRNKERFKTAILFHCGGLSLYP